MSLERACQETWDAIRAVDPRVPAAVVRVDGSRRVREATARWWTGREDGFSEVILAPFARPEQGLGRLLHEAAHGVAAFATEKDTSRGGFYHNDVFRQHAAELGLEVSRTPHSGWGRTVPTPEALTRYGVPLAALREALAGYILPPAGPRAVARSWPTAVCSCGRKIRISRRALAVAPIRCEACRAEFHASETR